MVLGILSLGFKVGLGLRAYSLKFQVHAFGSLEEWPSSYELLNPAPHGNLEFGVDFQSPKKVCIVRVPHHPKSIPNETLGMTLEITLGACQVVSCELTPCLNQS